MPLTLSQLNGCDIYLLDLILKGKVHSGMRVLDLGCGHGRNTIALRQLGCDVWACDPNPQAISTIAKQYPDLKDRFSVSDIISMPKDPLGYDLVIVNAVFHFAPNRENFISWANAAWSQVREGGIFFSRLSTTIAWPENAPSCFPFLATEDDLLEREDEWQAKRTEPLKTTRVEKLRTMTTWILQA